MRNVVKNEIIWNAPYLITYLWIVEGNNYYKETIREKYNMGTGKKIKREVF